MTSADLLAMTPTKLATFLHRNGLGEEATNAVVEIIEELKRLRTGAGYRPQPPGLPTLRDVEGNEMKKKLTFGPLPADAVSQHLTVAVGGTQVLDADYLPTDTESAPFDVDPGTTGVDVTGTVTCVDAAGNVSLVTAFAFNVPAPVVADTTPPDAPGLPTLTDVPEEATA